jgi:hypothetical protein
MPTRFFVFLAAADRLCDALISTRPHDSNPDWGNSLLGVDVRFESASDISVRPAGRTYDSGHRCDECKSRNPDRSRT